MMATNYSRTIRKRSSSRNKSDTGAKELANHDGEKITEGLDGLRERCAEYFAMGASIRKWRAVIRTRWMPASACLSTNAHALARYSSICQEQGLVPIIEPEVLMDGDHDADACYDVTSRILNSLPLQSARVRVSTSPGRY